MASLHSLSLKFVLVVAVLASVVTATVISRAQAPATASARGGASGWEYKSIFRQRGWSKTSKQAVVVMGVAVPQNSFWYEFEDWTTFDNGTKLPPGTEIKTVMAKAGSEGWELVSVTPISSFAGSSVTGNDSTALAGATSEMVYWFKRPKR